MVLRQLGLFGLPYGEHLLWIVVKVLPQLVTQVGGRIPVADDLHGSLHVDAAVIGGDTEGDIFLRQRLDEGIHVRMFEPGARQGTESLLVAGQLTDDVHLGTRMGEHVDEIVYEHHQVVLQEVVQVIEDPPPLPLVQHLAVSKARPRRETFHLPGKELLLESILVALLLIKTPVLGITPVYLQRHHAGKHGIAGILRHRRQDTAEDLLLLQQEILTDKMIQQTPLIIPQVVHDDHHRLLPFLHPRENPLAEDGRRENRRVTPAAQPGDILPHDETAELALGLTALVVQHLSHTPRSRVFQLHIPVDQPPVDIGPCLKVTGLHDAAGEISELILITRDRMLLTDTVLLRKLLQRQQQLLGSHRLDQIIRYLRADGLLHQILLLTLGDHHHRQVGDQLLDTQQGVQTAQPRHLLVDEHHIKRLSLHPLQGIHTVGLCLHMISLLTQEKDLRAQQVYLIIHP